MPRKSRKPSGSNVYHFINRGVNKKTLFHDPKDFEYYSLLLYEEMKNQDVEIYHYCLMSNHTHLLMKANDVPSLSRFGHYVQRRYAYYYQRKYAWPEQVFRKRFLSIPIDSDAQLLECGRYIERNPVEAKLVSNAEDYSYSSYLFYAYQKENMLLTPSPLYKTLGTNHVERTIAYRFYIRQVRQEYEPPKEARLPNLTCPF